MAQDQTPAPTKTETKSQGRVLGIGGINYIVEDLDAMLERLQEEDVTIDPKRMSESYGRFACIYDSDGNKIELWEPPKANLKP